MAHRGPGQSDVQVTSAFFWARFINSPSAIFTSLPSNSTACTPRRRWASPRQCRPRQLMHGLRGGDTLGDAAHGGKNIGQFLSLADLLANRAVAPFRAETSGDQIAQPGQAAEMSLPLAAPWPNPSRVISTSPRAHHHAALALYPADMPSRMPAAMAMTFLVAPASSTPVTSILVYTRSHCVENAAWKQQAGQWPARRESHNRRRRQVARRQFRRDIRAGKRGQFFLVAQHVSQSLVSRPSACCFQFPLGHRK